MPLLRRLGDPELLQWAVFESAFAAIGAADWDAAERRITDAIAISERSGHDLHGAWFTAHLGWVERQRGRYDRAVELGRRAVRLTAGTHHRWFATTGYSQLGATLLELGRTGEAVDLLTLARDRAEHDGAEAYLLRCLAPLAEATGSPAGAGRGGRAARRRRRARRAGVAAGHRRLSGGRPGMAAAGRARPGPGGARPAARGGGPALVGARPGRGAVVDGRPRRRWAMSRAPGALAAPPSSAAATACPRIERAARTALAALR